MGNVVQQQTRDRQGLEIIDGAGAAQLTEAGVLGMEGQGDEGQKPVGFVLRLAKSD